jgi:hypothetical protein
MMHGPINVKFTIISVVTTMSTPDHTNTIQNKRLETRREESLCYTLGTRACPCSA